MSEKVPRGVLRGVCDLRNGRTVSKSELQDVIHE
jgi:hypothetical protein